MLGRGRFWFLLPPSKRDPPSGRKGASASPEQMDMFVIDGPSCVVGFGLGVVGISV